MMSSSSENIPKIGEPCYHARSYQSLSIVTLQHSRLARSTCWVSFKERMGACNTFSRAKTQTSFTSQTKWELTMRCVSQNTRDIAPSTCIQGHNNRALGLRRCHQRHNALCLNAIIHEIKKKWCIQWGAWKQQGASDQKTGSKLARNKRPHEDLNATPNKTHVSNPGIKLFNSVSDVRLFLRQHLPRDLLLYTSTAGCQKGAKKMFEYGSERPFRCTWFPD